MVGMLFQRYINVFTTVLTADIPHKHRRNTAGSKEMNRFKDTYNMSLLLYSTGVYIIYTCIKTQLLNYIEECEVLSVYILYTYLTHFYNYIVLLS